MNPAALRLSVLVLGFVVGAGPVLRGQEPPTVAGVRLASDPGSDSVYKSGDAIEVVAAFSTGVTVTGTPRIGLTVGTGTRFADYAGGSTTTELLFRYQVGGTDLDGDGVAVEADGLQLNGGAIVGNASTVNAVLAHPALADQAGHKVDGVKPALTAATVSGRVLTLAFGETLGGGSAPSPESWSVTVDGASRGVESVAVDAADVVLTLSSPVGIGEKVLISDASSPSAVGDVAGNAADALSDEAARVLVNIVFILADDHAASAVSSYGSTLVSTPNIDRLARNGVRFDRALAPNAICQPARATLLTGKYAHRHGVASNGSSFDGSQRQVQHLLGRAGFRTSMIGKWHLESAPQGFDHWEILLGQGHYYSSKFKTATGTSHVPGGYTTDVITDKAIAWMKANHSAKRPFMTLVWHKAAHRPWDPSVQDVRRFEEVRFPVPETFFDSYAGRASPLGQQQMRVDSHMKDWRDLKLGIPQGYPQAIRDVWVRRNIPAGDARTRAEWKLQTYLHDYMRVVHRLDHNMGRVLDYLEASGLDESTLLVYASDQGHFLGEHGWFDKRWFHEESLRFPLIVRPPANGGDGSAVPEIVSQTDIAPTLLEVGGVEAPSDMQGRSLLPFLEGRRPTDWRTSFYYHYLECPGIHRVARHRAVITDRYKLVHYYQSGEWELFDRSVDEKETANVYRDAGYAERVTALKAELARLRVALGDVDGPAVGEGPAFLEGTATRLTLAENSVGAEIGSVFRTRAEGPPAYSLEGDDASSFGVVACNGQLLARPGVSYDYESKSEYALTVKVTDTWGRSDAIDVTVVLVEPSAPPEDDEDDEDDRDDGDDDGDDVGGPPDGDDDDVDGPDDDDRPDDGPPTGGPPTGGPGGPPPPPPDDEEDDEDDGDDGGPPPGGPPPGGGGPPRAAMETDAECEAGLCRARTGAPVSFRDASAGSIRSRMWEFGDGRRSRSASPSHAWASPGFHEVALVVGDGSVESTASLMFLVEAAEPAGACAADEWTRCLGDSRYAVTVEWRGAGGESGRGRVAPAGTNESAMFRFFDANNWEVLIKVLDGCEANGHAWVFGASTTDLGFVIRVTDTLTAAVKEYRNEPGTPAAAITDVKAFPEGCR